MNKNIRCAIYTRKSTEEGLQKEFNTLEAQREYCEAFIKSQGEEGWQLATGSYDDGGYSGGTLNRPALQQLLKNIEAGKIDVVIVYKVDRLTRSLVDFAKLVDLFDRRGVSFVSVTQQFNTTTSMGRLTLNVLLSFAQFERELSSERIRDKIAISKQRGMWMGGRVPFGYALQNKKLVEDTAESGIVRFIFLRYHELASLQKLRNELKTSGIRTRSGKAFGTGMLANLLKNRIYIGEVNHKGQSYPGQHEGIVKPEDFCDVQEDLQRRFVADRPRRYFQSGSFLAGILVDENGRAMTPVATKKASRYYRYYVSQATLRPGTGPKPRISRVCAKDIEEAVEQEIVNLLNNQVQLMDWLGIEDLEGQARVVENSEQVLRTLRESPRESKVPLLAGFLKEVRLRRSKMTFKISLLHLRRILASVQGEAKGETVPPVSQDPTLEIPIKVKIGGKEQKLILRRQRRGDVLPDPTLLKAVAKGHFFRKQIMGNKVSGLKDLENLYGMDHRNARNTLILGFLAPDIIKSVMEGHEPIGFTLRKAEGIIESKWTKQRMQLGVHNPKETIRLKKQGF